MSAVSTDVTVLQAFATADQVYAKIKNGLAAEEARTMTHAELEADLEYHGKELLRCLLQDHFILRSNDMAEELPRNAEGVLQTHRRGQEDRQLVSIFGKVVISRTGYTTRNTPTLYPADAALNLPPEQFSSGLQKRILSTVGTTSFDRAIEIAQDHGGPKVAKRQVLEMAQRGAHDFDPFYAQRSVEQENIQNKPHQILVLSTDAKGIVMRRDGLRECTRKAAENKVRMRDKRLCPGEKSQRKRMAQVAAVYSLCPWKREPADIAADLRPIRSADQKRPRPINKRIWASVQKSAEEVIGTLFEEAIKRDPERDKTWVGLVDGNGPQIDYMLKYAEAHKVKLTLVLDVIHMLEYLWKAVSCFCESGSKEAEEWVTSRYLEVLKGGVSRVAAGIRRSATMRNLRDTERAAADKCANYLLKHKELMRYDTYLAAGFPVGTGVIEGACRYLIKDRMDITGARWGLAGAEAVLQLRALQSSGDFEAYWGFHQQQEYGRNHAPRYHDSKVPAVAPPRLGAHLTVIK